MVHGAKLVGASAATALAFIAFVPAASATTAGSAAPAAAACHASTSPLKTCAATIAAPAGRIAVGKSIKVGLSNLKPNSKVTFAFAHGTKSSVKSSAAGVLNYTYKPAKAGTYVLTVSGLSGNGKAFAHAYTISVVGPAAGKTASQVTPAKASAHVASATGSVVSTTLASSHSLPSSGVSLNSGDMSLLAVALLGGAGCVGGLVVSARSGRRVATTPSAPTES